MNHKNKGRNCITPLCIKEAVCKGYCYKHYQQIKFNGKIKQRQYVVITGICKNIGCGKKIFAKDLCQKCYLEEKRNYE